MYMPTLTSLAALAALASTVSAAIPYSSCFHGRNPSNHPFTQVAARITIEDIGIAASSGGRTPSCIPACAVYLWDEQGCTARVDFSGPCYRQRGYKTRTVCGDVEVYWDVAAGAVGSTKGGSSTVGYPVGQCDRTPRPLGGCTYDGGCQVNS